VSEDTGVGPAPAELLALRREHVRALDRDGRAAGWRGGPATSLTRWFTLEYREPPFGSESGKGGEPSVEVPIADLKAFVAHIALERRRKSLRDPASETTSPERDEKRGQG